MCLFVHMCVCLTIVYKLVSVYMCNIMYNGTLRRNKRD